MFTFEDAAAILCRPGERLVAGKPWTYDLDALNAYLDDQCVREAPEDLSALGYDDLSTLCNAALSRKSRRPNDPEAVAFARKVCAERASRPEYKRVYG